MALRNRRIVWRRGPRANRGWRTSAWRKRMCRNQSTVRLVADALPSLDPYMRGRMNAGPSYAPPVEVG